MSNKKAATDGSAIFLRRLAWICLAVAAVMYVGGGSAGGDKAVLLAFLSALTAGVHERLDAIQADQQEKPAAAGE